MYLNSTMKRYGFGLILLVVILLAAACEKNDSIGVEIQPTVDRIVNFADTFIVESENYYVPAISAHADTMILGEYYNSRYGSTKADLLVQLAPPVGYEFPDPIYNPQPDSLILMMFYNTWFGSSYSPLEISIYELNKERIEYDNLYWSNLDPGQFTDSTVLMGRRLATSVDMSRVDSLGVDTASTPYIRYILDDTQLNRFFNIPHSAYESEEAFLDEFNGMYITTRYGSSTMLHLNQITMFLYYHYTYRREGKDTTVSTSIIFPANREVRQLNRYYHKDIQKVAQAPDSLVYIKSAAGIYPKIKIPIGRMAQRMRRNIGDLDLNISGAELNVELIDTDDVDKNLLSPSYLLALSEDEFEDFIRYNTPPTSIDTTAVVASYTSAKSGYAFNLNYFITKHLRNEDITPDQTIDMILVPVVIEGTTYSISSIKPLTKLSAASARSGKNSYSPMRLKVLYNGF